MRPCQSDKSLPFQPNLECGSVALSVSFCPWQEPLLEETVIVLGHLFLVFMLGLSMNPLILAQNDYRYINFLNRHHEANPRRRDAIYCKTMMERWKLISSPWRDTNTFIHGVKNNIKAICGDKGSPYRENLRISTSPFQVTICKHKGGSPWPPCRYQAMEDSRHIVIGCENGLPVHFEESFIRS